MVSEFWLCYPHDGKVRDVEADADTVSRDGPLEQKTESDWIAVRNSHDISDDKRATARAVTRNTAGRPNRSLRDIIVPTSHAGVDVEQRLCAGVSEVMVARTVPSLPSPRFPPDQSWPTPPEPARADVP